MTHMTREERIQRVLRDLDWGYSDTAIVRRTGCTRQTVWKYRRLWNAAWWAARDARRAKIMTPRSRAELEQGVGTERTT